MRRLLTGLLLALFATPAAAEDLPRVRTLVSDLQPLVGSAVEQCLEIEYRDLPREPARIDWPLAEGFVLSDLPPRPIRRIRVLDQPRFLETTCRRLVPLRSGALPVPAARIRRGQRELLGGALVLAVSPLPTTGRPPGFGGAVGTVEMALTRRPAADDSATYELTLAGSGPLDLFPPPVPQPDAPALLLQSDHSQRRADGRMERRLVYRTPAAARPVGFALALYDPRAGRYLQLQAGAPAPDHRWLGFSGLGLLLAAAAVWLLRRRPAPEARLAAWAGVPPNALDRTDILQQLQERGFEPELLAALRQDLLQPQHDRFAPSPPAATPLQPPRRRPPGDRALRKAIDKLGPYRR